MPLVLATAMMLYTALGVVFGLAFVARGARVIDPSAATASFFTRLLWLPAATGLWPMLLARWISASRNKEHA